MMVIITKLLEVMQRAVRGEPVPSPMRLPPPVAQMVGFDIAAIDDGSATMTIYATERHHNPMGTVHGGIFCDIADAAMGMAHASTLTDRREWDVSVRSARRLEVGESFTTLELKINFLRPVRSAKIKAVAKVVHRLLARATSTVMTLRGEAAVGR